MVLLAYHLEWSFVPGGVFSVSLFFTLSGYLITQLAVREFESAGRIDLAGFWARRLRRLMPAALVTVLGVAVLSIATPIFDGPRLRGDLFAALGYVANWRFAASGNSYEDLFTGAASPLQHFWSLAIEEQFYFAFPVVMVVLLALGRVIRRPLAVVTVGIAALAIGSLVAGILTDSRSAVYYGTHVRAIEILAGALLALALPVGREIGHRVARSIALLSTTALIGFFVLSGTVHTSDDVVYGGGLAAFSVVACVLILGALVPGPVRSFVTWAPLMWVGRLSYGIYVFHWPVFVAMTDRRFGGGGWWLDLLRVATTIALAMVSFHVLEEPIRRRRLLSSLRVGGIAVVAAVAVVVGVVFVVARPAPVVLAGVDAPDRVVSFDVATEQSVPEVTGPRILVVGSDVALGEQVRGHVASIDVASIDVVDRARGECAIRLGGGVRGGCPSLDDSLADIDEFDVVVVGVGDAERTLVEAMIGDETAHRLLEFSATVERRFSVPLDYATGLETLLADHATLIVDRARGDELGNRLADLGARRTSISYVDSSDDAVWRSELDLLLARLESVDDRTRVVVIGDSVSYGVARALNDVSRDRYSVVWAGGRNCPLVDVQRIRWWDGVDFDLTACPNLDETWVPLWSDFAPEILVVVVSVPEQSDQQYEPGGEWYAVGDVEFARRHDEAVARLVELAASTETRVIFFTSPTIHGGALGDATFGELDRVEGWNRTMFEYGQRWSSIEFFDWAGIVERYESANGGEPGSLRADGVHMGEDVLAEILGAEFVPFLDGSPS